MAVAAKRRTTVPPASTLSIGDAKTGNFTGGGGGDVCTLTLNTQAAKSSLLLVVVDSGGATPTFADNIAGSPNSYAGTVTRLKVTGGNFSDSFWISYLVVENITGETGHAITATLSTTGFPHGFGSFYAIEIKDTHTYATAHIKPTVAKEDHATPYTDSITTTLPALILSFIGCDQTASVVTHAPGTGPAKIAGTENTDGADVFTGCAAWNQQSTAGLFNVSWTAGATIDASMATFAFVSH